MFTIYGVKIFVINLEDIGLMENTGKKELLVRNQNVKTTQFALEMEISYLEVSVKKIIVLVIARYARLQIVNSLLFVLNLQTLNLALRMGEFT